MSYDDQSRRESEAQVVKTSWTNSMLFSMMRPQKITRITRQKAQTISNSSYNSKTPFRASFYGSQVPLGYCFNYLNIRAKSTNRNCTYQHGCPKCNGTLSVTTVRGERPHPEDIMPGTIKDNSKETTNSLPTPIKVNCQHLC